MATCAWRLGYSPRACWEALSFIVQVDQKGNMRVLPQKKRGMLSLEGIRFYIGDEVLPVEVCRGLQKQEEEQITDEKKKELLQLFAPRVRNTAVACGQGDLVILEGSLEIAALTNPKMAIARLPKNMWPRRRETFFTRGRQEERRRVDVDVYGRIFCPEGADKGSDGGGYVDLSGIIFIRGTQVTGKPRDPDWDELREVRFQSRVAVTTSSVFPEQLEQFIRRCNVYEWKLLQHTMAASAGRRMIMPGVRLCGGGQDDVPVRGWERGNEFNLGKKEDRMWRELLRGPLEEHYGITSFHTLLHLSAPMLDEVLDCCPLLTDRDRRQIRALKHAREAEWERMRQPRLTYQALQAGCCRRVCCTSIVELCFIYSISF